MKIEEIKTIVKLMSENDLTEFKIEAEEYNLCIKRGGNTVVAAAPIPAAVAPAPVAALPAAIAAPAAAPAAPGAPAAAVERITIDAAFLDDILHGDLADGTFFQQLDTGVHDCIARAARHRLHLSRFNSIKIISKFLRQDKS